MCLRRNGKHDTVSSVDDTRGGGGGVGSFGDVFGVGMSVGFEECSTGWECTHVFGAVSSVADRFTEFEEGTYDIEFIQVFGIVSVDNVSAEFDEGTKGIQVFGVVSVIEGSCG